MDGLALPSRQADGWARRHSMLFSIVSLFFCPLLASNRLVGRRRPGIPFLGAHSSHLFTTGTAGKGGGRRWAWTHTKGTNKHGRSPQRFSSGSTQMVRSWINSRRTGFGDTPSFLFAALHLCSFAVFLLPSIQRKPRRNARQDHNTSG